MIKGYEEKRIKLLDKLNQEQVETETSLSSIQQIMKTQVVQIKQIVGITGRGIAKKEVSVNIVTKQRIALLILKKAGVTNYTVVKDT